MLHVELVSHRSPPLVNSNYKTEFMGPVIYIFINYFYSFNIVGLQLCD